MNPMRFLSIYTVFIFLAACQAPTSNTSNNEALSNGELPPALMDRLSCDENVRYQLTFDAIWIEDSHPNQYPSSAHFSPVVGATHTSDYQMWAPSELSSPGVQRVAETGNPSTLRAEIDTQISLGNAKESFADSRALFNLPNSSTVEFSADSRHTKLSAITMIAPSPDWIIGVHDLELCKDGQWVNQVSVDLLPYDAGTDSGSSYTSANLPTIPAEPITAIVDDIVSDGSRINPFGRFTITRL